MDSRFDCVKRDSKQTSDNCNTLYIPEAGGTLVVETDTSLLGLGMALFKEVLVDDVIVTRPAAFISRVLTSARQRSIYEHEGLAIHLAVTT